MLGILCEKPSAARNFAKAFGGMSGVYQGTPYLITHARGHLYEYQDPDKQVPKEYASTYKSWNLNALPWDESLFSWKRKKQEGVTSVLQNIQSAFRTCDEICIATDVDPSGEGELIAWEIFDELKLHNKKVSRMYFVDESVKELQKAFVSRKVLPGMLQDMDFVKAQYRSQWDMLSMQFTRIATICAGNKAVLRQGRLKSAMVQIVGNGLKAVREYKRVPFYSNKFKDENGVIYTNPDEPTFPDKSQVPQMYQPSAVVKDSTKMMATAPPKLIDLAALSAKLASKGYKAKEVLDVYQKMYEAQIVSYPRTEDKTITPEQFQDLLPLVDRIASVVGVSTALLTHRQPRTTHVKAGGAHGANRPGPNVPASLQSLVQYGACGPAIYEILARNYLAMLAEDYQYEQQKGHIALYPKFVGSAAVPKARGWKDVFSDEDLEDEESLGLGTMANPFIAEGANPKPPTPTMKWLMKQLEKVDVGTGATRTSTYADVTSSTSKYPLLRESKGKLDMTEYGTLSYELLQGTYIGDVSLTKQVQDEMKAIAGKQMNPADGLYKMREYVRHDMTVMQNNAKILQTKGVLNMAGTQYPQKEKYSGVWVKTGKQVNFNRTWGGYRFTDDECEKLLAGLDIEIHGLAKKNGTGTYGVRGRLDEGEYNGHKYVGFQKLDFLND